eukprot:SAG11_NODE_744_length_7406_cov_2.773231_7_plen_63_part_00
MLSRTVGEHSKGHTQPLNDDPLHRWHGEVELRPRILLCRCREFLPLAESPLLRRSHDGCKFP